MKLVNMKRTEEKKTENMAIASPDSPVYPYGLNISLGHEEIKKLGLKELPKVGSKMKMMAMVEITSVSQYESKGGVDGSISLQITDLGFESPKREFKGDELHGKKEA